jgi:multimeric flavodoxin WrbA
MKALGINGSPRKLWNTATLLQKALEGAASKGADTELVHLYDLAFKGCVSCFGCKTIGGPSYGRCAMKDALTPLLEKITSMDVLILGSPIYFGSITGEMQSFIERFLFPYSTYTDPPGSIFPGKIRAGFIYTFGADENMVKQRGFDSRVAITDSFLGRLLGHSESICAYDTYQFEDYSKVFAPRFDPEKKAQRRKEVFPEDCNRAFEMGKRLASDSAESV